MSTILGRIKREDKFVITSGCFGIAVMVTVLYTTPFVLWFPITFNRTVFQLFTVTSAAFIGCLSGSLIVRKDKWDSLFAIFSIVGTFILLALLGSSPSL